MTETSSQDDGDDEICLVVGRRRKNFNVYRYSPQELGKCRELTLYVMKTSIRKNDKKTVSSGQKRKSQPVADKDTGSAAKKGRTAPSEKTKAPKPTPGRRKSARLGGK